jgi:hypothetical protein
MREKRTARDLRKIELSFAYDLASGWIDAETNKAGDNFDWHDLATAEVDLSDAVDYLESRRLLERHPEHPEWVRICDEDEPLP